MKGIACVLLCVASSFSMAVRSDRVLVQLGLSRSGAPQQTRVSLLAMGDGETVLARGDAVRFDAIEPSHTGSFSVKLDREVEDSAIKKIAMVVTAPSRSALQISQVSVALGATIPRRVLVQEIQSRVWDGGSKRFMTAPIDEGRLPMPELRLTGRTVDDNRVDNSVEVFVQLINGQTFVFPINTILRSGEAFNTVIPLPDGTIRGFIKRIQVVSSRSSARLLSFNQQFFETDDIRVRNFRVDGGVSGNWFNILDLALLDMPDHKVYQSPDLAPGLDILGPRFGAKWFNVYLYTGGDDLRWDPNAQPNMEVKVNIYLRGNRSPIPVISRSLEPYANFANGGVFGGKFENYCIAERKADWRQDARVPLVQDIEAVEVETVPGWNGDRPGHSVIRGNGDPFRQPDEWAFRGIVFGVAPDLPRATPDEIQPFAGWTTILCDFGTVRKLKVGEKVRFPVKFTSLGTGPIGKFPRGE